MGKRAEAFPGEAAALQREYGMLLQRVDARRREERMETVAQELEELGVALPAPETTRESARRETVVPPKAK